MESFLEPIGLGPIESAVYLRICSSPGAEFPDVAPAVERRLIDAGLISRLAGQGARYVPAPPDVAIDALALRRQEALERLRAQARDLARDLAEAPRSDAAGLVELIEGDQAVLHVGAQMQLGAQHEVAIVDCPPYLMGQPLFNHEQTQSMRRGVSYRAIYHAPVLESPEKMADVLQCIADGEQARVLPSVDLKMLIADRRVALIPLVLGEAETHTRILVHPSPLLRALIMCFDLLWERALPLSGVRREGLSDKDTQLLTMLSAGMKDRAIARALGIAERTVTRRVSQLMEKLGVETRFQAGLVARSFYSRL